MSQVLFYCFTLNNYGEEEYAELVRNLRVVAKYYIIGKEVGDSATPHIQGYVQLKKRDRITGCKAKISRRAHWEVARGSPSDNRTYCSKEGNYEEEGEIDNQTRNGRGHHNRGRRDELFTQYQSDLVNGRRGISEFAINEPGVYGFSGHTLLRNALALTRAEHRPDVTVEWVFGDPGVGKSRYAHNKYPDAYVKDPRTKWWNGYLLERAVILDDFGKLGIDMNHLLRWFDRYKCYVETKGGMCPLLADKFIVTSNFSPEECFTDTFGVVHPQINALLRRITVINM